jgi:hypothetical protein
MFVPSKRIPIHPDKTGKLIPGERFDIDSGMGGSFEVSFTGYNSRGRGRTAGFQIECGEKPPEGWKGEKRSIPIAKITEKIYLICPECPILDKGNQEQKVLDRLGYPADAIERELLQRKTRPLKKASGKKVEKTPEFKTRWGPSDISTFDNKKLLRLLEHIEQNPENQQTPEERQKSGDLNLFKKEAHKHLANIRLQIVHNMKQARIARGELVVESGFSGRKCKKRR